MAAQPCLLVFQMCSTSGSVILITSACLSRKSKKYLMACGTLVYGLPHTDRKRFSTNECTATFESQRDEAAVSQ